MGQVLLNVIVPVCFSSPLIVSFGQEKARSKPHMFGHIPAN